MSGRSGGRKATKAKGPRKSDPVKKEKSARGEPSLDSWPAERDVLVRPERLRYVRKLIKTQGCVFCKARDVGVSAESLVVAKLEHAMLILNKFPYNPGHALVLPLRHVGEFEALTDAENAEIQRLIRRLIVAQRELYQCDGFNVGLNLGAAAGAGIPSHLHWHVVPRWSGDTNFFPLLAKTKVVVETLETTHARLLPYFGTGSKIGSDDE